MFKFLKQLFANKKEVYDFNKSNPLGDNGERVDIVNGLKIDFQKLDLYQKNHFKRYEFATTIVEKNDVCADFACGTGYGSIMLSKVAKEVYGADINEKVISEIKKRYQKIENVHFSHKNLLELEYEDFFDSIISFETLEHFTEENLENLLHIFSRALKKNGKLIFSTPYMQEKSQAAMELGFHLTFYIDEHKITHWLEKQGFYVETIKYQNYDDHFILDDLDKKEFIICVARKK